MADKNETLHLDLDNQEFVKKLIESKGSLMDLFKAENADGLLRAIAETGIALGVMGAAVLAMKTAMDLVFDAENIKQVNAQFEMLSENAGVSADKLKDDLVAAADGMASETDVLKAANKALVEMGSNAEKAGEVMKLARQETAVFGGDLLSNFEALNQAIANGNQRALKHMGIQIDVNQVYKDYAHTLGITTEALSQGEKQHAMMNAVLEAGGERFKGVNLDITEAKNTWQQLKVTLSEVGEAISTAFEEVAGPAVRNFLRDMGDGAKTVKLFFQEFSSDESVQSEARLERLNLELKKAQTNLESLEKPSEGFRDSLSRAMDPGAVTRLTAEISNLKKQIEEEEKKGGGAEGGGEDAKDAARRDAKNKKDQEDADKRKKLAEQIDAELTALRKKQLQAEIGMSQEILDIDINLAAQREIIEKEAAHKKAVILQQYGKDNEKAKNMIEAVEKTKNADLLRFDADLFSKRKRALDDYVAQSKTAAEGITRAFQAGSKAAESDLADFGKTGQETYNEFKKNSISALQDLGSGQKSASEAAKEFIFNMLGDRAEAEGTLIMMSGLATLNPLAIAGGGALVAFGAFLKSQAGGASTGAGGSGAVPVGANAPSGSGYGDQSGPPPSLSQVSPQKSVNINVSGSYFETEQTKMALVDLIRQNQDATDYKVQQVSQV